MSDLVSPLPCRLFSNDCQYLNIYSHLRQTKMLEHYLKLHFLKEKKICKKEDEAVD